VKRFLESPAWRIIIYLAGLVFAAGVFYASQSATNHEQARTVAAHSRQLDDLNTVLQSNNKTLGEIQGTMADFLRALQAEHDLRQREEDRFDERLRYLERHH
jgi:flagellar motility protein MotE (MotC chaperone)